MKNILLLFFVLFSFTLSAQNGISWSPAINVASSAYDNMHPRIVTDRSGDPLVIWGRGSDESVFFSKWNGTGFTMPMKVNSPGLTVATQSWMGPDIAAKGDTVYVVMKQTPEADTTKHIYISRSFNGGATFSAPLRVDYIIDSISRFPTVTTDDMGNPIVGFMKFNNSFGDTRWVVSKSVNYGSSFYTDVKASGWSGPGAEVCDCCPGSIVSSGNRVAMLYRDNLNNLRDMWAGISYTSGNSFFDGLAYDQGNWMLMSCPSSGPDGVIIGDSLYTTYMSAATGNELVYTNASSLSLLNNSAGSAITGQFAGLTQQNYPRMASVGNAIATVWRQSANGDDYLISRFSKNVAAGMYDLDTIASSGVMNADVAVINGKVFAVWQDYNSGTVKYRMGTFQTATSISKHKETDGFIVYPNPTRDLIMIELKDSNNQTEITLLNALGQVVAHHIVPAGKTQTEINTKDLTNDVYFVTVTSSTNRYMKKIVVAH
ncbi:MAG: hypothetical protein K0Q95_3050 [Bacteroidota bacterium]|jgi:hypothetical protein|nr:hypothetical protein [Bacteroidota bacterium]